MTLYLRSYKRGKLLCVLNVLQRHIECPEARAGQHERDAHGQEQYVIVNAVGKQLAFFGFESELDDQDGRIQDGGQLGVEADDEEYRDEYLDIAISGAVRTGAGAAAADFLIAGISQSRSEDDADDERPGLLVCEQ